jgi:hypothetical protein
MLFVFVEAALRRSLVSRPKADNVLFMPEAAINDDGGIDRRNLAYSNVSTPI